MRCPKCNEKTEVTHTTPVAPALTTRRRKCVACGHIFRTCEQSVPEIADEYKTIRPLTRGDS